MEEEIEFQMPVFTNQEKLFLMEEAKRLLATLRPGSYGYQMAQVTLAALTAKPVGYTSERAATYEVWNSGSATFCNDNSIGDYALYGVPVIPTVVKQKPVASTSQAQLDIVTEDKAVGAMFGVGDMEIDLYTKPVLPDLPGIGELVDFCGCTPSVRDVSVWTAAIEEVKRRFGVV